MTCEMELGPPPILQHGQLGPAGAGKDATTSLVTGSTGAGVSGNAGGGVLGGAADVVDVQVSLPFWTVRAWLDAQFGMDTVLQ